MVELLAVIVVLAIILVIAVPKITKTIDEARIGALSSTAQLIAKSAEKRKLENETLGIEEEIKCEDVVELDKDVYGKCNVYFNEEGKATVKINGAENGKFHNKHCQGTSNNMVCGEGTISTVQTINCTFDGELFQGAEHVNGQYTYRYMQQGGSYGK